MKNALAFSAFLLTTLSMLNWSCNDPTLAGTALTDQDRIGIAFADTFDLRARTVPQDRVITFDPTSPLFTYLLGQYDDPIFGSIEAGFNAQVLLPFTGARDFYDDSLNLTLDSVVLVLQYDTAGFYANWEQGMSINVFEIAQALDPEQEYFSDDQIALGNQIGNSSFVPSKIDSAEIFGMTEFRTGRMRIPVDDAVGMQLMNADSATLNSDSLFTDYFKGVALRPEAAQTDGIVTISLVSQVSNLVVYYKRQGDTSSLNYAFRLLDNNSPKTVEFNLNNAASTVAPFLDDWPLGDSLLFLQGGNGPRVEIEMPAFSDFSNIRLSKAELVLTAATLPGDDTLAYRRTPLITGSTLDMGEEVAINDLLVAQQRASLLISGGLLSQVDRPTYILNVTDFVQSLIDESAADRTLFLSSYLFDEFVRNTSFSPLKKTERIDRVVLYGPGHSQFPMKLRLYYYII